MEKSERDGLDGTAQDFDELNPFVLNPIIAPFGIVRNRSLGGLKASTAVPVQLIPK